MHGGSTLVRRIRGLNWDFPGAFTGYATHRFHWYPGTFIPQIPAYLIELLSKPGDLVFDPFCGAGTTLVEALRLRRRSVGADVNPVACLATTAKTAVTALPALRMWLRKNEHLLARLARDTAQSAGPLFEPNIPAVKLREPFVDGFGGDQVGWYHPVTFRQLRGLHKLICKASASCRICLDATFSGILKAACSQRNHWGYIADNMLPRSFVFVDALALFMDRLQELMSGLAELDQEIIGGDSVHHDIGISPLVVQADVSTGPILARASVDLIVTSPPYASLSDYLRSQRLSLPWLGYDVERLKHQEIGARWKRHRQDAGIQYVAEMKRALAFICMTLKPGCFLCLVLGPTDDTHTLAETVPAIERALIEFGLAPFITDINRRVSQQRLRSRSAPLRTERILIYKMNG